MKYVLASLLIVISILSSCTSSLETQDKNNNSASGEAEVTIPNLQIDSVNKEKGASLNSL